MKHLEIIEILNRVEKEFNVNSIQFRGVCVWPVIRFYVINSFIHTDETMPHPVAKQMTLKNALGDLYFGWKTYKKHKKQYKATFELDEENEDTENKPVENLFLAKNGTRYITLRDKRFNFYLAPYINFLKLDFGDCKIVENSDPGHLLYPRYTKSRLVDQETARTNLLAQKEQLTQFLTGRYHKDKVENYDEFLDFCLQNNIFIYLYNAYDFKNLLLQLWQQKEMWGKIFKQYKPKKIFILHYEQPIYFMAILAANELSIHSIDLQHGLIGKTHPTYTCWASMPKEGYQMLPSHFWCWGDVYTEIINEWACKTNRHKAFSASNMWLLDWKKNAAYTHDLLEGYANVLQLDSSKPTILFSLQFIENPDFIYNFIKATQDKYQWIIRLHPGLASQKEHYINYVHDLGIRKAIVQTSQEIPLYIVLQKIQFHVTRYSTVAIEAFIFDVPSIIMSEYGKKNFQEAIEAKAFYYTDNEEGLHSLTEQYFVGELDVNLKYTERLLLSDDNKIKQNLNILN